ncbi:hypothetical protein M2451_004115 [Dysgonomonas sp. PFB1-18]|nr:hypothetical protein [Dysgonomonas sp. PF1-14]MDH6341068.1 hypothetical protein [Dysgonomonas sp. PF1-16]MDH6382765.1 hypothetical protein [Dysgonomonas sp. PFB1-18]MDH6400056.1 hypothetical protein [Dysgonomonas sp. PF1-23]MDL2303086.1 helix-turn-helix domain-containing protein [Dysgonomonas sp. OttesenSCG-928-D17]
MNNNLMAVVSNDFLEQLKGTLEKVERCLKEETKDSPMWMWVKSEDARQMFGVSRKTWQTWRDRKYIPYSQFGQKIYFHLDDLNSFMVEHKIQTN